MSWMLEVEELKKDRDALRAQLTAAQVEIGGLRSALTEALKMCHTQNFYEDVNRIRPIVEQALKPTVNASAGERVIEALKLAQRDLNTWTLAHEKVSEALAALKVTK